MSSEPSGTAGLAAGRRGKDQGWVLGCCHRSESEHQVRNANSKIKRVINSGEEKRLNYGRDHSIGTRLVCCLTPYFHSGSLCAINPISGQELCLHGLRHRAAGITSLFHHRVECLQHLPPKQSSLSLKAVRNSQSSKIYTDACRSTHARTYVYITCFIYKSRFCIGTG